MIDQSPLLSQLPPGQVAVLKKLAGELPYYSKTCLKIISKEGEILPFVFNRAQEYLHKRIEEQKSWTGRVRIVILKGRQQGCTTYVQGRFFHKTQFRPNLSAYILAHQSESTLKIYAIASKFQTNLPAAIKFPLIKNTERAMTIENGSSYTVGTAGSAQIGRGMTVHLFHGSEVAFYENADELSVGLMQTVADVNGTEMIFESTANGPGNFFYNLCMGAVNGKNGFELIFIPWYWQAEYMDPLPLSERELTPKEVQYFEAYKADGLTLHHLAWRRRKIAAFEDKEWKFIQEYPFNPDEAFVRAEGRFFDLAKVYAARGRKPIDSSVAALVVGIDQGRTGDDTKIRRRKGKILFPIETIPADDGQERDMRLAGRIARIIDAERPDKVFLDTTNEHGALDRLHELGYKQIVRGIHFGEQAMDKERYRNKRTEMHFDFAEWIQDPECSIPMNEQRFLSEVGAIPEAKETSNCIKYLVSKDDIKKDLGWSPDELDATVLTFAYPVKRRVGGVEKTSAAKQPGQWKSKLKSLRGERA
jgi:hypothetical protein